MGKSIKIIGRKSIASPCLACNEKALSLVGSQTVYNIFWIPVFPLKKSLSVVCGSCGSTFPCKLYEKELSKTEIRFKAPWWYLSGSAILIMLFSYVMVLDHISRKARDEEQKTFFKNPQPGTCFAFVFKEDVKSSNFLSIGKVESVKDDKVLLSYSRQSHWEQGGAMDAAHACAIKNPKLPSTIMVTLEQLKEMDIWDISFPNKQ